MARWERDPKARKRLAILLAVVNDAMLLIVVFLTGSRVLGSFWTIAIGPLSKSIFDLMCYILVGVFAVWLIVQTIMYVMGREWARWAYIILNISVVGLGSLWFIYSWVRYGVPKAHTVTFGLLIPILLLFPLLWPHFSFRPQMPQRPTRQEKQ